MSGLATLALSLSTSLSLPLQPDLIDFPEHDSYQRDAEEDAAYNDPDDGTLRHGRG